MNSTSRRALLRAGLLALPLALAACVVAPPPPPPQPSTYERAWNAMLAAMNDQGVQVTAANQSTGTITGQRSGITVTAQVTPQGDGTTKVEFRTKGDIGKDPQLIERLGAAYNARMGR
jgi:hypothetical protein